MKDEDESCTLHDSSKQALVIEFKRPFLDWINKIEEDSISPEEEEQIKSDCTTVVLLPRHEEVEDIEYYLQKNYARIFRHLLNEWYTDQELWPKKLSYEMFREWFKVNEIDWVFDMNEEFEVNFFDPPKN
jgi:hypothetical protein